MNIYMIGIKGTGMSSMACILKKMGNEISGCDVKKYVFTEEKLRKNNISFHDFSEYSFKGVDLIIVGNSFYPDHELCIKAREDGKRIMTYQTALATIASGFESIAVCGTHGKTTSTKMIKEIFASYFDISYLIGDGEGGYIKNSTHFIFEACEYQDHFLSYKPVTIVLTNVDYDHVDYFKTYEQYKKSFSLFLANARDLVIYNSDLCNVEVFEKTKAKKISFGIKNEATFMAKDIIYDKSGVSFILYKNKEEHYQFKLPLFGEYMLYNALCAIATALAYYIPLEFIEKGLLNFKGASRRFSITKINDNIIIDDYGHHPREISETMKAIKQKYADYELIIIYQPDRISRLETFLSEYKKVFDDSKKTYVLPFINKENIDSLNLYNEKINKFSSVDAILNANKSLYLFTGSKDMSAHINSLMVLLKNK